MNNFKYNRRSIRLNGYDYSKSGYYFVTICVNNRYHLFGEIVKKKMLLNKFGKIAEREWQRTEILRTNFKIDEFIVMPNHLHGIIVITNKIADVKIKQDKFRSPSNNLGAIIRGYKSTVSRQINKINNQPVDKIWQRNYYDHIIQNLYELNIIRKYIRTNPRNWDRDS